MSVAGAAEAAKERGKPGSWVFTLHRPSLTPFLQYSSKRELREKMFKAYINRGSNGNELDNKAVASKIAALRVERAEIPKYHDDVRVFEVKDADGSGQKFGIQYQLP